MNVKQLLAEIHTLIVITEDRFNPFIFKDVYETFVSKVVGSENGMAYFVIEHRPDCFFFITRTILDILHALRNDGIRDSDSIGHGIVA